MMYESGSPLFQSVYTLLRLHLAKALSLSPLKNQLRSWPVLHSPLRFAFSTSRQHMLPFGSYPPLLSLLPPPYLTSIPYRHLSCYLAASALHKHTDIPPAYFTLRDPYPSRSSTHADFALDELGSLSSRFLPFDTGRDFTPTLDSPAQPSPGASGSESGAGGSGYRFPPAPGKETGLAGNSSSRMNLPASPPSSAGSIADFPEQRQARQRTIFLFSTSRHTPLLPLLQPTSLPTRGPGAVSG
jgi:hypothetical protein